MEQTIGLDGTIVLWNILSVKPRKEKILKIHIELPHIMIDFEREPMAPYKFYVMRACVTACVMTLGFFSVLR